MDGALAMAIAGSSISPCRPPTENLLKSISLESKSEARPLSLLLAMLCCTRCPRGEPAAPPTPRFMAGRAGTQFRPKPGQGWTPGGLPVTRCSSDQRLPPPGLARWVRIKADFRVPRFCPGQGGCWMWQWIRFRAHRLSELRQAIDGANANRVRAPASNASL